ncbi:MAG: WYL domain-containing protein [Bacteroidia bacterium]|nr:WYL domain-containing protein [Bacteroidia bacterium]
MPANRNALIRYRTIDTCLQNRYRKWTLEDLIEKVSEALYEFEGIEKGISRRTIQADIQFMRSDKLGYNAPIIVVDKKYYTYEDKKYSITNIPLNEQDLNRLNEAVDILKQFKGFSHFKNLDAVIQKLEDHTYAANHKQSSVIDFEKNEALKGLEYLDCIYQAIIREEVLLISYRSFKAKQSQQYIFHAWWLKEFKNRWFVVGRADQNPAVLNLALDRILAITQDSGTKYRRNYTLNPEEYYRDVVGVSVSQGVNPEKVILRISRFHAPYIETKPIHHSQKVVENTDSGVIIELTVQLNFELEKEILSFGEGVTVLEPASLRKQIRARLEKSLNMYKDPE